MCSSEQLQPVAMQQLGQAPAMQLSFSNGCLVAVEVLVRSAAATSKVLKDLPALCEVKGPAQQRLVLQCYMSWTVLPCTRAPFACHSTLHQPGTYSVSAAQRRASAAMHLTSARALTLCFCCLQQAAGAQAASRLGAVEHVSAEVSRRRHAAPSLVSPTQILR